MLLAVWWLLVRVGSHQYRGRIRDLNPGSPRWREVVLSHSSWMPATRNSNTMHCSVHLRREQIALLLLVLQQHLHLRRTFIHHREVELRHLFLQLCQLCAWQIFSCFLGCAGTMHPPVPVHILLVIWHRIPSIPPKDVVPELQSFH